MVFNEVLQPFIEKSPLSVMFRGTLEHVFNAERLDSLFERTASKQYCRQLLFSTCAELLGLVVTKIQPSLHAAYRTRRGEIGVSVQALYQKVAGIEPAVSESLVRETAGDLAKITDEMKAELPGPLPGYDVRIVDGNYLAGTQHRLKELRRLGDAALPGQTVAVLNPHRELIEDIIVCEDGHANQKPLFRHLLPKVQRNQCWISDRDFSTPDFLFGIKERHGYFLIRQHGQLKGEMVGRQRRVGRVDTGMVYEQKIRLTHRDGCEMVVRRITLKLDKPTRDKDTEIHLLTNLPKRVSSTTLAMCYQSRWNIEAAFHKLTMVLECELDTLGYPDAALFGFCLAVVMYNVVNTLTAALRAAHPQAIAKAAETRQKLSFYYLANEISGIWRGMAIVVDNQDWTVAFAAQSAKQIAKQLLWLAGKVKVDQFITNPVSPKKRKQRRPIKHGGHVSTYRILEKRKLGARECLH
jgi:hypothetical protein